MCYLVKHCIALSLECSNHRSVGMGYRVEKVTRDGWTATVHRLGDSEIVAIRKATMCKREAPEDTFRVKDPAGRVVYTI